MRANERADERAERANGTVLTSRLQAHLNHRASVEEKKKEIILQGFPKQAAEAAFLERARNFPRN